MNHYRKFYNEEQATDLAAKLEELDIPVEIIYSRENIDFMFGDKQFRNEFIVNLRPEDFEKADQFLLQSSQQDVTNVEEDHYLFKFTDEELMDIIAKPDEWSELDYLLAKKILTQHGKQINAATVDRLKEQRLAELKKPEEQRSVWIIVGYFSAWLGGLFGIAIGYVLLSSKKTLPNGERVFVYSEPDRKDGVRIFFFGIIIFVIMSASFLYDLFFR